MIYNLGYDLSITKGTKRTNMPLREKNIQNTILECPILH